MIRDAFFLVVGFEAVYAAANFSVLVIFCWFGTRLRPLRFRERTSAGQALWLAGLVRLLGLVFIAMVAQSAYAELWYPLTTYNPYSIEVEMTYRRGVGSYANLFIAVTYFFAAIYLALSFIARVTQAASQIRRARRYSME